MKTNKIQNANISYDGNCWVLAYTDANGQHWDETTRAGAADDSTEDLAKWVAEQVGNVTGKVKILRNEQAAGVIRLRGEKEPDWQG